MRMANLILLYVGYGFSTSCISLFLKKKCVFLFSEAFTNPYLTKIENSSLRNKIKSSLTSCSEVSLEVIWGSSGLYPDGSWKPLKVERGFTVSLGSLFHCPHRERISPYLQWDRSSAQLCPCMDPYGPCWFRPQPVDWIPGLTLDISSHHGPAQPSLGNF